MSVSYYVFALLLLQTFIIAKIYDKCTLINELTDVHKLNDETAAKLACIAEVADFDTSKKVVEYTEEDSFGFRNYMCKYGIFRFSSEYWCSERGVGGICNINCNKFLDDDIRDDLRCVMQIQKNILIYNSWGYDWPGGVKRDCNWGNNLQQCAETKNDWRSPGDCYLKYPELPKTMSKNEGQNGVKALKHEFPHAAAIGWTQLDKSIKWACGGSLIAEHTILTAAHCTFNHDGVSPDIVRLGDLNLITDDDEKETQQFTISSIIRHPSYRPRYNDIALIKLQSKVNVTKFVTPACLWPTHEIPVKMSLEACGFGQTQYGGDISSVLNKVILSYLDTDSCQESYQGIRLLKDGLKEQIHLCASDRTGRNMDTCEGDSGSPLEMKLHLDDKTVPFIVGITAFGKLCGAKESPGVYTRVSSFIDWIKYNTPELPSTSLECAVQYRDQRPFETNLSRPRLMEQDDLVNAQIYGSNPSAKVTGVIISNRFVLTSAQKLSELSNPNRVQLSPPNFIDKITYFPGFNIKTPEKNDIAIVRLRQRISLTKNQFPLCLSTDTSDNKFVFIEEISHDQSTKLRLYHEPGTDLTVCQQLYSDSFDFKKIDTNKILCFLSTTDINHVPGSCDIPVGTPIYAKIDQNGSNIMILKGMALFSKDCGPVIATKVSAFANWIEQEIFLKIKLNK